FPRPRRRRCRPLPPPREALRGQRPHHRVPRLVTVPDHDAARALPPPVMDAGDLTAFLAGAFPDGVQEVVEVTSAGVVMRFPIRAAHQRPGGTVSGPTLMAAADAAAWMATLARIGPVALAVTSNLTINFLRKPSLDADLWARAELL